MAKPRKISGLRYVMLADRNPFPGPRRLNGSQAAGIAFQNRIGNILQGEIDAGRLEGKLYSDLWLYFEDKAGTGYAQPDHFILRPKELILFECKLSQNSVAWGQMKSLYVPLLSHLFQRPIICVQAFKRMRYEEQRPMVSTLRLPLEFVDGALWHQYK